MALTAQITLSILAHETSSGDISRTLRATPVSYALSLADGTGANQAQVVWSDSRTLSGSSETLTPASLSDTRDGAAVTVTLTAIKAAYIKNTHASIGLTAAGGPFGSGYSVPAGGAAVHADPTAAGLSASGITVTASAGAAYDIVLIGEGSVA